MDRGGDRGDRPPMDRGGDRFGGGDRVDRPPMDRGGDRWSGVGGDRGDRPPMDRGSDRFDGSDRGDRPPMDRGGFGDRGGGASRFGDGDRGDRPPMDRGGDRGDRPPMDRGSSLRGAASTGRVDDQGARWGQRPSEVGSRVQDSTHSHGSFRTTLCRFYSTPNGCMRGEMCTFAHGVAQLRVTETERVY
jgi:hypothetical protein